MSEILLRNLRDLEAKNMPALCEAAALEIERLRARLEIAPEAPAYDGIACRDETIKQQDAQIAELRSRISDGIPAWIPVTERMPELGQLIAIRYSPDSDVCDAYHFDGDQEFFCWTPLPETQK